MKVFEEGPEGCDGGGEDTDAGFCYGPDEDSCEGVCGKQVLVLGWEGWIEREMERDVQRISVWSVSATIYLRRTMVAVLALSRISVYGRALWG